MNPTRLNVLRSALLMVAALGCQTGGDDDPPQNDSGPCVNCYDEPDLGPPPPPVDGVNGISADAERLDIGIGRTTQVNAQVDADPGISTAILWEVDDREIVEIYSVSPGSSVLVKGLARGETTLRAVSRYDESFFVEIPLTIDSTERMQVQPDSMRMPVGRTHQMELIHDGAPDDARIEWRSSDPSVASVDANGLVTAEGAGGCEIIARSATTGLEDSATVEVSDPCAARDFNVGQTQETYISSADCEGDGALAGESYSKAYRFQIAEAGNYYIAAVGEVRPAIAVAGPGGRVDLPSARPDLAFNADNRVGRLEPGSYTLVVRLQPLNGQNSEGDVTVHVARVPFDCPLAGDWSSTRGVNWSDFWAGNDGRLCGSGNGWVTRTAHIYAFHPQNAGSFTFRADRHGRNQSSQAALAVLSPSGIEVGSAPGGRELWRTDPVDALDLRFVIVYDRNEVGGEYRVWTE